ncbi:hypothetical protein ALC56_13844 [Trachymyrmex septentrionalis]|uniref:Uncharacterized protein n=1 Tax=Trachymyrmex septentrionalis TaxID=34720 RepID=A0A195ETY0_9HYME|nr:hypothetical protein ALC56_13844 [Trachymyrmex septentrionalis]
MRFQIFNNARFNQDNPEFVQSRFFISVFIQHDAEFLCSMNIRTFFIQMYKLMSPYLLVKSSKVIDLTEDHLTNVLMSVRHKSNKATAIVKSNGYIAEYIARKGPRIVKFRDRKQLIMFKDCLKILVLGLNDIGACESNSWNFAIAIEET